MTAARQERLRGALQARLDACAAGDVVELTSGEYEGPFTIRCAMTLSGQPGVTLWARSGPVVTVAAAGVVLRGLTIEVTDLPSQVTPEGACALDVTAAPDIKTEEVVVAGTVAGAAAGEREPWVLPAWFDLGKLSPFQPTPQRKSLRVTVPLPCAVRSSLAALAVEPQTLGPGTHHLHLLLDAAGAGREIEGFLALDTHLVSRRIAIAGRVARAASWRAATATGGSTSATPPAESAPAPAVAAIRAGPAAAPPVARLPTFPSASPPADSPLPPPPRPAPDDQPGRGKRWLPALLLPVCAAVAYYAWASWHSDPAHLRRFVPLPDLAAVEDTAVSVALSPDGKTLARGGSKGTVDLFDTRTGRLQWRGNEGSQDDSAVRAVAFSIDGNALASGGDDVRVWLWDTRQHLALQTLRGANDGVLCLAFSPDGALLAAGEKAGGAGHATGGKIRLWDTHTGELVWTAPDGDRKGDVLALAFSADGKWLATGGADRCVLVWNVQTRENPRPFCGLDGASVLALAVSADGATLAAGASDHTVRWWARAEAQQGLPLPGSEGLVRAVRAVWLSADARILASADETLAVISRDTRSLGGGARTLLQQAKPAGAMVFSRDGKTLASANRDGTVSAWRGE